MMDPEQITGDMSAPVYLAPSGSNGQVKQSQLRLVLANDPSQASAQVEQMGSQAVTFLQIADDSFVQNAGQVPQLYQLVPQAFQNQQVVIANQEGHIKSTQASSSNNPVSLTSHESVNSVPVPAGEVSLIESNGQQYLIVPNFTNQQIVIQNQADSDQSQTRTAVDAQEVPQAVGQPPPPISQRPTDGQYHPTPSPEKQDEAPNAVTNSLPRPQGRPPSVRNFHDENQKGTVTSTVVSDKVEITDLIPSFFTRTVLQNSEISGPMRCAFCKHEAKTLEELQAHYSQHKATNDSPSLSDHSLAEKKKLAIVKKKKQIKSKKAQMIRTEPVDKPPEIPLPTTCSVCHHEIKTLGQYRKHLKLHKNDKPHRCNECGESFNKEHNLKLHLSIHKRMKSNSGMEKYECPECHKVFSRMASLKMHILLHAEEESFICKECGDEFACNEDLEAHVADHDIDLARHLHDKVKVSQILSGVDGQTTQSSGTITVNIEEFPDNFVVAKTPKSPDNTQLSQSEILPPPPAAQPPSRLGGSHQCGICLKYFQKRFQLLRHMLIHTGEKPHSCKTCGRSFNQKGALQKHMSLHSGEKPFSCPHCPQTYRQRGNLNLHIKRVHLLPNDGQETFACKDCPCIFKKIGSLHAHVTKYHIQKTFKPTTNGDPNQQATDIVNQALEASVGTINPNASAINVQNDTITGSVLEIQRNRAKAIHPMSVEQQQQTNSETVTLATNMQTDLATYSASDQTESQQNEASGRITSKNTTHNGSGDAEASVHTPGAENTSDGQAQVTEITGNPVNMRKIVIIDGVRYHRCTVCNKGFKKPSDLTRHIRIHTSERPYECKQCGKAFTVKSSLTSHIRSHLGLKPHRCQVCHKNFTTGSSLRIHQRLHTGARPFPCLYCDKRFRTTGHRTNHMLSHFKKTMKVLNRSKIKKKLKPDLSHVQLLSPLVMTSTGQLRFHNSSGSDLQNESAKTFNCKVCSKSFATRSSLKLHSATHAAERPFVCQVCAKSFTAKAYLKQHLATHSTTDSSQTNYKCDICGRHFTTKRSRNRHAITHSKERPFVCPYCRNTFKTSEACRKHMETHREEVALMQSRDSELPLTTSSTNLSPNDPGSVAAGSESTISRLPTMEETLDGSYILNIQGTERMGNTTLAQVNPNLVQDLSNLSSSANIDSSQSQQQTILLSPTPRQNIGGQGAMQNEQQLTLEELASLTVPQNQNQSELSLFELGMPPTPDGAALTLSVEQPLYVNNINFLENIATEPSQSFPPATLNPAATHNAPAESDEPSASHDDAVRSPNLTTVVLERPKRRGKYFGAKVLRNGSWKIYQCLGCEAVFSDEDFIDHVESIKEKEDELPFPCDYCCHRFPTQVQHSSHIMFHTIESEVVFKCSICGVGFDDETVEAEHNKSHPPEPVETRGEKFLSKVSANTAYRTSRNASKSRSTFVKLTQEQNQILSQTNPNLHMTVSERVLLSAVAEKDRIVEKVAEGRGRYKALEVDGPKHKCVCPYCPKSFKKRADLTRHIRTHTGEKPFACRVCGKQFSIKSYLTTHEKTHTGLKEYCCHICKVMYATKASLKVHMRLHTGSLPFKCPRCPKRFRTSGHRITHIKTHTTKKPNHNSQQKQNEEFHDNAQPQNLTANNVMLSDLTFTFPEGIIQGTDSLRLQWNGQNLQLINGGKDTNENITLQIDPVSLQQAIGNITPTTSQDLLRNYTRPVTTGPAPNLVIQPITLPESVVRDLSNGSGAHEVNVAVPASLASLTQMLFQSSNSTSSIRNPETMPSTTESLEQTSEKTGEVEKDITLAASAEDSANQGLQPFSFELLATEDIQQTANQQFAYM